MPDPAPLSSVTPEQFRRIRAMFEAAMDLPATDRRPWLEAACGDDIVLLRHVERLIAASSHGHGLLDLAADETREAGIAVCLGCGATVSSSHMFCPSCGTPTAAGSHSHEGRFRAGTLFAGRFRIVGLLGRGGMGEVYRAHDLELGQQVGLKFLRNLGANQKARQRLRTEVRLARTISHANVCRVYDIGEAGGELYLSMEYVDGEDMAALLKRIGRLPVYKGVEVARRLCAGLDAAHTTGVLHRDLKPGNVMLDSRGEVRIMDFGLAAFTERVEAGDIRSGTAAYMAPEQLEGHEATARSDLYALGLVLYELFTGKPAFEGRDAEDFHRLREALPSVAPSTLVPGLDAAIERTILRCLEPDPRKRFASALEVAAALPGADPLADAVAAGETPSPDLVAAARTEIAMRPAVAVALLLMICVGLGGSLLLTERTQMVSIAPKENSPDVLAAKARDFVRTLGYGGPTTHLAYGFRHEHGYLEYFTGRVSSDQSGLRQWTAILQAAPGPVTFWYAQGPTPLVPPMANTGIAIPIDSLPAVRDAVSVDLDLDGRLLRFVAPLKRQGGPPAGPQATDWQPLFTAAALDRGTFVETVAGRGSSLDAEVRVVWTGSYPGRADLPVRIEGAATAGIVTSFAVLFPWTKRDPMLPQRTSYAVAVLLIGIWITPCLVARFNWRRRRADMRGALRIGAFAFFAHLASLLLNAADPLDAFVQRPVFWLALALGTWTAIVYLALEPWVRRWWPAAMIGWARVLAGRCRDPIVARDVLVALALVTVYRCLYLAAVAASIRAGAPPLSVARMDAVPGEFVLSHLAGPQFTAANFLSSATFGVATAAMSFFLLALFRSWLGKPLFGIIAFCAVAYLWSAMEPTFRGQYFAATIYPLLLAIWIFISLHYGLLALIVGTAAYQLMAQSILTADVSAWYGRSSLAAALLVSGLAVWAFRIAVSSRSLDAR